MDQPPPNMDEDQDSLFGSPPPSPARGRSPFQETPITGQGTGPISAVPSMGARSKNVGTIALPGSHMSCAELPADLPASRLSLPQFTSSHGLQGFGIPSPPTPAVMSRSSTRSVPSRASSAASSIPSSSPSTRKRRTSRAKSLTSPPSAPPISLPGPNEPTPPNLLRSQSSLLGLAGLVGSVKPAQLYTHNSQSAPVQKSRPHLPVRGSTPDHPIVLDDDQDTPHIGKHPYGQLQMPQRLDQLDPDILHSNIMNSLAKEKNIFPVLESLIKLLGGEPYIPPVNPPPRPFARPYGHGIFNDQPPFRAVPISAPSDSALSDVRLSKRRKLKHVPAGAVDWDIPFPFAAGEGPQAYRDNWARDRAKQLVAQLLELVQNAAKMAAIKTAKSAGKVPRRRTKAASPRSSRSASVETQMGQIDLIQASKHESPSYTGLSPQNALIGVPSNATPAHSSGHCLDPLKSSGTVGSSVSGPEGVVEGSDLAVPCDNSAFEDWLSQLQQFVPETHVSPPESNWVACPLVPLESSASSPVLDMLALMQHDVSARATRDEAIDPALLAMSQQAGPAAPLQPPTSSTSALAPDDVPQVPCVSLTPPVLAHSSSGSFTEPLTPSAATPADASASTTINPDLVHESPASQLVEKQCVSALSDPVPALSPIESPEPPRITAAQQGKGCVDVSTPSPVASASSPPVPKAFSTAKGALDKQGILERARERRRELVAEIERAKREVWETSIENAVLIHFMRDVSS